MLKINLNVTFLFHKFFKNLQALNLIFDYFFLFQNNLLWFFYIFSSSNKTYLIEEFDYFIK